MDDFLSLLAHELRNALAPLRNALLRLQREDTSDEVRSQSLLMMARQLARMSRLADGLADLSMINAGTIELHREPVDLGSVTDHVVEMARPAIQQGGHRLTVNLPPENVHLDADKARLGQILGTLLQNAAQHMDRNGEITIDAASRSGRLDIIVRDTGVGIDGETLARIFDPFAQADRATGTARRGLGVGLAVAKGLAELHGGSLEARSAGPGQGSEFVLQLPLAVAGTQDRQSSDDVVVVASARHRIVVADDNADDADSTALILRMDGHEVHTAYDGEQTMALVGAVHPDVVLLDIGLSKLDANEVARRIRAMNGASDMLLIAVSGWSEKDGRLAADAGFDHRLVKPVDPDALSRLLAQRVARDRAPATARQAATPPASPSYAEATAAAQPRQTGRVLVVDDNADVRDSTAEMLGSLGFDVQTAADAGAALEQVGQWNPDSVLIDIHMPGMNGFELARRLRASTTPSPMKLIMLCGVAPNEVLEQSARSAGFDGCIDKMADPARWAEMLGSAPSRSW